MCRVSTLRNVEPPVPKFLQGAEHLPRIEEAQGVRLPLPLIEEDGSAAFTLPFLVETKLPKISPLVTPILDFEETIVLEENRSDLSATLKEGTEKVNKLDKLPAARCPTPFFKGNDTNNFLKKREDITTPQLKVRETGKQNGLQRPKLRSTLSCPEVGRTGEKFVEDKLITPTPPKSPPKQRPSTPFIMNRDRKLLARSRSLDSKGLGEKLQAWSEIEGESSLGTDSPENAVDVQKASCATKIGLRRKIDRDKKMLPDFESAKPNPEGSSSPPCKIRMDKDVFNKWIREQRVS